MSPTLKGNPKMDIRSFESRFCVCGNLRKAARMVTQIYDASLRPLGIRLTQNSLLAMISMSKDQTIIELADRMVMDRTTLTRNLRSLEKKAYIKIIKGKDQRERRVALTYSGLRLLVKTYPYWQKVQDQIAEKMGEERLHRLFADLAGLRQITASM